jgi:SAM-dependent methyltransferase
MAFGLHKKLMSDLARLIFDRSLMRQRLHRAITNGAADFLADFAAKDLIARLMTINRSFQRIADIGSPFLNLSAELSQHFPEVEIFRLSPLLVSTNIANIHGFVGDEEALPLQDGHFDLAVSALALQYVNDLPGALIQMRRILKPDGLFLGCLIGGRSLNELRESLKLAETEIYGGVSPRVLPFADVRDMGGLLQRAQFALPVADAESLTVRYAHMFALMTDLRAMGATNFLVERSRKPARRAFFLRAAEIYANRFADPDGRIRATFELIFLSGWAPHESQQKPLRPGSAKMRLADALGKTDFNIPDK